MNGISALSRAIVLASLLAPWAMAADTIPLTALDLSNLHQGRGRPAGPAQQALAIGGVRYNGGLRTVSRSVLWIELDGRAQRFQAAAGIDDAGRGKPWAARFVVSSEARKLWQSAAMKPGQPAVAVDVDLKGVQRLCLLIDDAAGSQFAVADWAGAVLSFDGPAPKTIAAPPEETVLLTPPPGAAPEINGPQLYGCRPGHPLLYRVPTTGQRPIEFQATGLPAGLSLDAQSGIITGTVPPRGEYAVTLSARNAQGQATRPLKIVSGDVLSLTPSMGWNHWYAHYARVTDATMRQAADALVSSGMADAGYQYVNIDDCWMNAVPNARHNADPQRVGPLRDDQGRIRPNVRFPDMPALTAYIHAKGLKAGIYTSPGPLTCAGFAGAYQHEAQDARQFADWGFDFLKYDWCSYGQIAGRDHSLAAMQKPYRLMGDLLRQQNRDMLLNLCQYGMGNVWEWGAEVGGQSWRTAGDLGYELNRVFEVALKNAEHRAWSKPGAWNDPDYLQIGYIGSAQGQGQPRPCPLTPTEQYAFMSLWSLMASPLFYSGDMARLDPLTLNVLCNPEVIAVDQDPLGRSAEVKPIDDDTFLMVKPLADGSLAVGLCNRGEIPAQITARWSDLGLTGRHAVRDLWRRKDLSPQEQEFTAQVGRRGVVLVEIR